MFDSLLEPIREKWMTLGKRDQNSVLALAVALVLAIVVFGIITPIRQSGLSLRTDLDSAQQVYNELVTLAPQAMATGGSTNTFNASSINTEVRRQAARYGIEIQRFEPDGDFLKVWLDEARYPSVVQWLGGLETIGIGHTELTMEDRPKPGFVSVRVTFGVVQ